MKFILPIILIFAHVQEICSIQSPPMGWTSWLRYNCYEGFEEISEEVVLETADLLQTEGYVDLGYTYILLDDCWQSWTRTSEGALQANVTRFPSGISSLANQIHLKGLKLGLFSDLGPVTGSGRSGSRDYLKQDAETFAALGIDYIKMSACTADPLYLDRDYLAFAYHLQRTNKPTVLATSWPVYLEENGIKLRYRIISEYSTTFRLYSDMQVSWPIILEIMDHFANISPTVMKYVRPGHYWDPDVLAIGNPGLTLNQCKAQMAVWAILGAPLMMSNKLSDVPNDIKTQVLQNANVIAINQDLLGKPGTRIKQEDNLDIWLREVMPLASGDLVYSSYAVAFVNRNLEGFTIPFSIKIEDLGMTNPNGYFVSDLYSNSETYTAYEDEYLLSSMSLYMIIPPSGVAFFKVEALREVE